MGAHPWMYIVPHQQDIRKAMLELREREFQAGRYNPVIAFPELAPTDSPGAGHDSIDEAREEADADGTRSILDIDDIGEEPADPDDPQFGVISPIDPELLQEMYGTTQPTRAMIQDLEFMEEVERGTGVYIVLYAQGKPSEICFAGYSFD